MRLGHDDPQITLRVYSYFVGVGSIIDEFMSKVGLSHKIHFQISKNPYNTGMERWQSG